MAINAEHNNTVIGSAQRVRDWGLEPTWVSVGKSCWLSSTYYLSLAVSYEPYFHCGTGSFPCFCVGRIVGEMDLCAVLVCCADLWNRLQRRVTDLGDLINLALSIFSTFAIPRFRGGVVLRLNSSLKLCVESDTDDCYHMLYKRRLIERWRLHTLVAVDLLNFRYSTSA
jgi:hypothetical protein